MIERQKVQSMVIKQRRTRRGINLSSKKEDKSDIKDNTDLYQTNNKYLL